MGFRFAGFFSFVLASIGLALVMTWVHVNTHSSILAFLTIQSGSIWPALIFHATNNTLGSVGHEWIEKQNPRREILLMMATGLLLAIPFAILLIISSAR